MTGPAADKPSQGEKQIKDSWFKRPISWVAAFVLAVGTGFGSGLGQRLWTSITHNPAPGSSASTPESNTARPGFRATSGPSCHTGNARAMFTNGSWTPLAHSAAGSCGDAQIHLTTDSSKAANWIFTPGVGATCTFRIEIPKSSMITAYRATYQGWETPVGKHTDEHRIGHNKTVNQEAHRGGTVTVSFGPTKTTMIDLQLYDDNRDYTHEVAGIVTASCR